NNRMHLTTLWIEKPAVDAARSAPQLASTRETPFECRWSRHGRDDDHNDDGRKNSFVNHSFAANREAEADVRKDETDLSARNHPDADREPVEPPPEHAK